MAKLLSKWLMKQREPNVSRSHGFFLRSDRTVREDPHDSGCIMLFFQALLVCTDGFLHKADVT